MLILISWRYSQLKRADLPCIQLKLFIVQSAIQIIYFVFVVIKMKHSQQYRFNAKDYLQVKKNFFIFIFPQQ